MSSLYQKCLVHKLEIDHHESDLYIKAGEVANRLVLEYANRNVSCVESFRDMAGKRWWDVAFAYDPFWQAQAGAVGQGAQQTQTEKGGAL